MSASSSIQTAIAELLGVGEALRRPVPIVARRPHELAATIAEAGAKSAGLCAVVMPVLPLSIQDDMPGVFVDRGEIRVRLIEEPSRNATGVSAWMLADDAAQALHWSPKVAGTALGAVLAHPLQLAPRAVETAEDARMRIVDVIFHATYQLPSRVVPAVPFTPEFASAADDLQAAIVAQLGHLLTPGVPRFAVRDRDLGNATARSGHPLKIEVQVPRPARALQGAPFVFFESYDVRVKISELTAINRSGVDAYDLVEDVATTLHWQPFAGMLAHPLQLQRRPTEMLDDPQRREIEVLFTAAFGFQPPES